MRSVRRQRLQIAIAGPLRSQARSYMPGLNTPS